MTEPILTVVLPAYREEKTIELSLRRLILCLETEAIPFILRVVVDGPYDETASIARNIGDQRISVIELEKNFGKGRAVRTGFDGCNTEFVGYLDADLDLHPEGLANALKTLQKKSPEICGAIGSKVHPQSNVDYPTSRRLLSTVYKLIVRLGFSLALSDTQTGLKVFRTAQIEEVLSQLQSDGFEFDLEILSRLARNGYRFCEVPVHLDYKFESTINLKSGIRALFDTIALAIRLRFN